MKTAYEHRDPIENGLGKSAGLYWWFWCAVVSVVVLTVPYTRPLVRFAVSFACLQVAARVLLRSTPSTCIARRGDRAAIGKIPV